VDNSNSTTSGSLAAHLSKLPAGFQPFDIFVQLARIVALPIIEFVPLRRRGSLVEVLLLERPADDKFWPSMLHTPGTVIRATDDSLENAFRRIIEDELASTAVGKPVFVQNKLIKSLRGTEVSQIYWLEVTGQPSVGMFYNVAELPTNMLAPQREFIGKSVSNYLEHHG
jgi:hypothetical protein